MYVAQALKLSKSVAEKLEERNILKEAIIKHPFFRDVIEAVRFDKKFGEFEEGTVIAKTINGVEIVRGYPKIRRALTLYPTIKKYFKKRVVFEEKMNGYNVRIVHFGKNLYAITRRGFVCPYTTEKARELLELDFFKDHPKYMICCEAVGKESPYVPKDVYGVDFEFFVFDIKERASGNPLPIREKERLCNEYGLKLAPILGEADVKNAHEVARDIIKKLDEKGREGVVIKDPEMRNKPIKYTTSKANCDDLKYAFRYFSEYGKDFMFSRIIREAFQSFEFDESDEELKSRSLRLGESILKAIVESIKDVSEKRKIVEVVRLKFSDLDVLNLFLEHLKRSGIYFEVRDMKKEEGKILVEINRIMKSTTDKIKDHLKGGLW